jgi:hypothetical protein
MVAAVVVVGHEGFDLDFLIAREVVAPQQDAVFERLVPALDLALGSSSGTEPHRRSRQMPLGPPSFQIDLSFWDHGNRNLCNGQHN